MRFSARALWTELEMPKALLCLPALALILGLGVATGNERAALVATSGALSVGFGCFQQFTHHRNAPMLLAALGMALSAGVGSLIGVDPLAQWAVSALWAAGCAWLTALGQSAWWIVVQWSIALFVASAYPSDWLGAAERAALTLLGGMLQFLIIASVLRQVAPSPVAPARLQGLLRLARRTLRNSGHLKSHVLQAGFAVMLSSMVARAIELPNGYWAPMTALLVIRPDLQQTWTRVLLRFGGTVVGGGIATLAAALMRPTTAITAALTLFFAGCSYALRGQNYGVFSTSITCFVVFLLALAGLPEPLNALHRIGATLLGALISLAIVAIARGLELLQRRLGFTTAR